MSIVENSKTKLTYEDYVHFPDDGRRHEIMDGDHYVTPGPAYYHQRLSLRLAARLLRHVEEAGLGRVVTAPMDVLLSRVDIVQPDIVVVLEEHASIITERNIRGCPDLVVEILSATTSERDRSLKKSLYQRTGVREYWIVDPEGRLIEQYALGDEGVYALIGEHRDEISSRVLPAVKVDLSRIW